MFRLAPEGWPFVLTGASLSLVGAGLAKFGFSGASGLQLLWWVAAGVFGVLTLFTLYFFRNPKRQRRDGEGLVLAPADGRIVEIVQEEPSDLFLQPSIRISIFLSVFNVHLNRSPCRGRVTDVDYRPGKFLNALRPEADEVNESNTITLAPAEPIPGPVRVRQISGVLAKRIVCDVADGASLDAGQRYGMIKLGSRTEITLPEDQGWELLVGMGDKVRAGRTILARLQHSSAVPTSATQGESSQATADPDSDPS